MPLGGESPRAPGLGRGLSAILSAGGDGGTEATLLGRLVRAVFDGVVDLGPLDLGLYLHRGPGDEECFLFQPALSSLHPTQAYQLFSTAHRAIRGQTPAAGVRLLGTDTAIVRLTGSQSQGVFLFGRAGLTADEQALIRRFVEILAPALLQYDVPKRPDVAEPEVAVEPCKGSPGFCGHVAYPDRWADFHGADPIEAVAGATLRALVPGSELLRASKIDVGDESAVLVVATLPPGRIVVGAAPVSGEPADQGTRQYVVEASRRAATA